MKPSKKDQEWMEFLDYVEASIRKMNKTLPRLRGRANKELFEEFQDLNRNACELLNFYQKKYASTNVALEEAERLHFDTIVAAAEEIAASLEN